VLEGGYDLTALASSAVAHCQVLSAGYTALSKSDTESKVKEGSMSKGDAKVRVKEGPLSKSDYEALMKEGPQDTPPEPSHPVTGITASHSAEDGDGDGDCEKSYGGDEAAALAAHIATLDLGPSIRRP
jgi:hypothetical protein